jgi:hypothetical protein
MCAGDSIRREAIRPADLLPAASGGVHAGDRVLDDDLALELGHGGEDMIDQLDTRNNPAMSVD